MKKTICLSVIAVLVALTIGLTLAGCGKNQHPAQTNFGADA